MSFILNHDDFVFADSVQGRVRIYKPNEDSQDWKKNTPNGDVFVVCDGMGGHAGGKVASSTATERIIEHLQKERFSDPREALRTALEFANIQILRYANEHLELKGMGTTACVLLLQDDDKAWIAHVGDSRIYLFKGKEKQLHRITKDHSYVQLVLVEKEGMSEEEAEQDSRKNIIMKALGIQESLNPEVAPNAVLPKKSDIFLICSDGLTGMVPDSMIEKILADTTLTLHQKGQKLIYMANENGGKDNITVQLIQIEKSPYPQTIYKSYNPANRQFNEPENTKKKKKNKAKKHHGTQKLSDRIKKNGKIWKWVVAAVVAALIGGGVYRIMAVKASTKGLDTELDEKGNNP